MVVTLRYPILLAWIGAAVAATMFLPGMAASGAIGDLVPKGSPGSHAEYDATRLFGLPLTSQVNVVQRNPSGFGTQPGAQDQRSPTDGANPPHPPEVRS